MRHFKAARLVASVALSLSLLPLGAQGIESSLASLGFRKGVVDLSPIGGIPGLAEGVPRIYHFWRPSDDQLARTLEALAAVPEVRSGAVELIAVTDAKADLAAKALKPVRAKVRMVSTTKPLAAMGVGATPSAALSGPDGKAIAVRFGPLDWSSREARTLVRLLAEAHPATAQARPGKNQPEPGLPPSGQEGEPAKTPVPAAEPLPTAPSASLSAVERETVAELNFARTNPEGYAVILREYRSQIKGNLLQRPGEVAIRLNEGVKAVDEAIAFLERQPPLAPLAASRGLSSAARFLADDQAGGRTGHDGSDGSSPFDRMNRFGKWTGTAGENCAYGGPTARDFVIQLIVDDGVPSRGHRKNIFNPAFRTVGVAVGRHSAYRFVCVQDFAGGYEER